MSNKMQMPLGRSSPIGESSQASRGGGALPHPPQGNRFGPPPGLDGLNVQLDLNVGRDAYG